MGKPDDEFPLITSWPPSSPPSSTSRIAKVLRFSLLVACFYSLYHSVAHLVIGNGNQPSGSPAGHHHHHHHHPHEPGHEKPFSWATLPTLPELNYVACYDGLQCARLEVPMDYWNGTTDATVSIAILKIPANVPVDDSRYRGPILVNPGGPGGSGVSFASRGGRNLQTIVQGAFPTGTDLRSYDIIGFDPRGDGMTEPAITCSGDPAHEAPWLLRIAEEGTITSSDAAFGRLWAMNAAWAQKCAETGKGTIQQYLTTAYVARDMLEIVEASARLKQRELHALGSSIIVNVNEEKLQYWGFSYGSILGNTFAAMFPERVGRLIADGVPDAYDYSEGSWWTGLTDSEKVLQSFYHHCARVGHSACPLADKHNPSSDQVSTRVLNIIQDLWHNPIAVTEPFPDIITWSDVRRLIFKSLYTPLPAFPLLATILYELEHGETQRFADLLSIIGIGHSFSCPSAGDTPPDALYSGDSFRTAAILCSDAIDRTNTTQEQFIETIDHFQKLSPFSGDIWSVVPLPCLNYDLRPIHRFPGPYEGDTAHPVLLIGNTADPVTPLVSARRMAEGFKDAVVLTVDIPGHCSISGYSKCAFDHISQYFLEGTLPEQGTLCEANTLPFGPGKDEVVAQDLLIAEEMLLQLDDARKASGGAFEHGGRVNQEKVLAAQRMFALESR